MKRHTTLIILLRERAKQENSSKLHGTENKLILVYPGS